MVAKNKCDICAKLDIARIVSSNPEELGQLIKIIKIHLLRASIIEVHGARDNCVSCQESFSDLPDLPPWPADVLDYGFKCTVCNQQFELFADTYHGRIDWKRL